MTDKDIVLLHAVIETLGDEEKGISVRGYNNMKKVIGCIHTLSDVIQNNNKETTDG